MSPSSRLICGSMCKTRTAGASAMILCFISSRVVQRWWIGEVIDARGNERKIHFRSNNWNTSERKTGRPFDFGFLRCNAIAVEYDEVYTVDGLQREAAPF